MLRSNLMSIQNDNLALVLFKRNRYLKGLLRVIKIKFFAEEDRNATGISRAGWRLIHLEADPDFLLSLQPFPEDHLFPLGSSGLLFVAVLVSAQVKRISQWNRRQPLRDYPDLPVSVPLP